MQRIQVALTIVMFDWKTNQPFNSVARVSFGKAAGGIDAHSSQSKTQALHAIMLWGSVYVTN